MNCSIPRCCKQCHRDFLGDDSKASIQQGKAFFILSITCQTESCFKSLENASKRNAAAPGRCSRSTDTVETRNHAFKYRRCQNEGSTARLIPEPFQPVLILNPSLPAHAASTNHRHKTSFLSLTLFFHSL